METLLPSEIARLVLGYLQEQKCEEAAKIFLETSPLLQECLIAAKRGGKYATNVGGLSLTTILDKYCNMNSIILDKLRESSDSEHLKQSNDSLAQLKYLLEGSRGNHFVVNIKVPPQNSPGSSKVCSRKKNHMNSEHANISKSSNNLLGKHVQKDCDRIEKSFENIPLHATSTPTKLIDLENSENSVNSQFNKVSDVETDSPTKNRLSAEKINTNLVPGIVSVNDSISSPTKDQSANIYDRNYSDTNQKKDTKKSIEKCTAGTSTENLMDYCNTEVQTIPLELSEPVPRISDESVQNVTLISQELIRHPILPQRIAENINKSIQSVAATSKDNNSNEPYVGSIFTIDNAIKSIVEDPTLTELLDQIFEIDNSGNHQVDCPSLKPSVESNEQFDLQKDTILENQNAEAVRNIVNVIASNRNSFTNVEQSAVITAAKTDTDFMQSTTDSYMNDEQAVINASTKFTFELNDNNKLPRTNSNQIGSSGPLETRLEFLCESSQDKKVVELENDSVIQKDLEKDDPENKSKKSKAKTTKKRLPKPKPSLIVKNPENDIPTVPTLIVCPKEEENESIKFLPICPKPMEKVPSLYLKTVNVPKHLLTPAQIQANKTNPFVQKTLELHQSLFSPQKQTLLISPQKQIILSPKLSNKQVIVSTPLNEPIVLPVIQNNSTTTIDSITLYSTDNSAEMKVTPIANMPIISLDDSTINFSGFGLSPFFKLTGSNDIEVLDEGILEVSKKNEPLMDYQNKEKKVTEEYAQISEESYNFKENTVTESESLKPQNENENTDLIIGGIEHGNINRSSAAEAITKNTPRTLLLSRSKNGRLSLSTPRRRNSHVRALNFNTPMKLGSGSMVSEPSEKVKAACRGSLFKSPPFSGDVGNIKLESIPEENTSNSSSQTNKIKTLFPVKIQNDLDVPAAPEIFKNKSQDNWSKLPEMSQILNENIDVSDVSPKNSQIINYLPSEKVGKSEGINRKSVTKRSWDEDLRKIAAAGADEENSKKISIKKNKKRSAINSDSESVAEITEKPKRGRKKKLLKEPNVNEIKKKNIKKERKRPNTKKLQTKSKKFNLKDSFQIEINQKQSEVLEPENGQKKSHEITPPAPVSVSKKNKEKSSEKKQYFKSPETLNLKFEGASLPNLDLETPQKTESELIMPPTPRIHYTPAESLIKSCRSSKYTDKSLDTPYSTWPPKTPCIVLTPKIADEDIEKKQSPYYEPSEEPKSKEVIEAERIEVQEMTSLKIQKNIIVLKENKAVEITRYGIVDNEDLASESKETEDSKTEFISNNLPEMIVDMNTSTRTDSDSDNESTKSNTSSSSSSSSTSSSSSNSSSSSSSSNDSKSSLSSPIKCIKSFTEIEVQPVQKIFISDHETEESEIEIRLQQDSSHDERDHEDTSPRKIFPILNLSEESVQETPAKNETAVLEASISETPIVSDAERVLRLDSLTNLTSKISEIITTSHSNFSSEEIKPADAEKHVGVKYSFPSSKPSNAKKPKIINVQKIGSENELAPGVSNVLQTLEEKRKRVMAKLVAPKTKTTNQQKQQNLIVKQKKAAEAKKKTETVKKYNLSVVENIKCKSTLESKSNKEIENHVNEYSGGKVRTSPRKKIKPNVLTRRIESEEKVDLISEKIVDKTQRTDNRGKEINILIPPENSKGILKAKVDQVKRDLFTDPEINNQRTTRSQSARRTMNCQKNEEILNKNLMQENLPGVLECLELMPANKYNLETETDELQQNSDQTQLNTSNKEFHYIHDDSMPIKESNLNENFLDTSTILKTSEEFPVRLFMTDFIEVFEISPSPILPLKSSKVINHKVQTSKKKKSNAINKNETNGVDQIEKFLKTSSKKSSPEKNKKTSKRKLPAPLIKEHSQNKKPKPDPHTLFKNIKIDEFLKSVHESNK